MIPNPLLEVNTFAVHAVRIWNASVELRTATTRIAATKVAKSLAMSLDDRDLLFRDRPVFGCRDVVAFRGAGKLGGAVDGGVEPCAAAPVVA